MARVTVNLTKDYWRHRYRFPEEPIETYYQTIPSAEDQSNSLEDIAEHLDTLEVARNCLDNVSNANRAATWLYYGEGMGPQEIGDVLGTSKSSPQPVLHEAFCKHSRHSWATTPPRLITAST